MYYFDPGQDTDVDEGGTSAKCYHVAVQYNKDKPFKWFFKVFCANCSTTQYLFNFYLYRGADADRDKNTPATAYPPIKLLNHPRLTNKKHILHVDNWFMTLFLVISMINLGFHINGTI